MSELPSFNIPEVERRRDRIVARLANLINNEVDIDQLTEGLLRALPDSVSRDAVFESARYLAGRPLVREDAIRLAWRLGGNIKQLKAGRPVAPWTIQQCDEWLPLQVLRCRRTKDSKDRLAFDFQLRVLAGSSCPLKINAMWSSRVVRMVSGKVGFSKPWGKYPFKDASNWWGCGSSAMSKSNAREASRSSTRSSAPRRWRPGTETTCSSYVCASIPLVAPRASLTRAAHVRSGTRNARQARTITIIISINVTTAGHKPRSIEMIRHLTA